MNKNVSIQNKTTYNTSCVSLLTNVNIFASSILNQTSSCLCSWNPQTRDHLLLSCDYSSDIWVLVFSRISGPLEMFVNWSERLAWSRSTQANNYNRNTVSASATTMGWKHQPLPRKMVNLRNVGFHIWKQSNSVLHKNTSLTTTTIFHTIDCEIRKTVSARSESSLCRH